MFKIKATPKEQVQVMIGQVWEIHGYNYKVTRIGQLQVQAGVFEPVAFGKDINGGDDEEALFYLNKYGGVGHNTPYVNLVEYV